MYYALEVHKSDNTLAIEPLSSTSMPFYQNFYGYPINYGMHTKFCNIDSPATIEDNYFQKEFSKLEAMMVLLSNDDLT